MRGRKREIESMVAAAGLRLESVVINGGTHYSAKVVASDGRAKRVTFTNTPSDHRGDLNKKSMLKRFARGIEGKIG